MPASSLVNRADQGGKYITILLRHQVALCLKNWEKCKINVTSAHVLFAIVQQWSGFMVTLLKVFSISQLFVLCKKSCAFIATQVANFHPLNFQTK